VSYTSNAHFECPVDDIWSDFRVVAEIRRDIIKQGKRNGLSRFFHATSDKEVIPAWRLDLSRILLVFNVRSVVFVQPLLTVNSQTELAINTHVAVVNTHTLVSDVHHDVVNIHTLVLDMRWVW